MPRMILILVLLLSWPAAGQPADKNAAAPATRPATAPAAPDEALINPVASEFLSALGAGEFERAHALTTAAYRKEHPIEAFKKEVGGLAAHIDLRRRMRLQVFASPQPADGSARRALAVWPTGSKVNRRRSVTFVVQLAFGEGPWRVEQVEMYEEGAGEHNYLRDFIKANPGSRPIPYADSGMVAVAGEVTKVTVRRDKQRGAEAPPADRTLVIDDQTRVSLAVQQGEQVTPAGVRIPRYVSAPGQVSDLKVGMRVRVESPAGQDRAVRISVEPGPIKVDAEK